jgi:hypothetical protein
VQLLLNVFVKYRIPIWRWCTFQFNNGNSRISGAWNVKLGMELEHNLSALCRVWGVTLFVSRRLQTWRRCVIVVFYPAVLITGYRTRAEESVRYKKPVKRQSYGPCVARNVCMYVTTRMLYLESTFV